MKKKFDLFLAAAVLMLVSSCGFLDSARTYYHILEVSPETVYIEEGEYYDMQVSYNYYDSEDPDHVVTVEDFTFKITDEDIAKVELIQKEVEYGEETYTVYVPRVTGLKAGSTLLLVTVDETSDTAVICVTEKSDDEPEGDEEKEEDGADTEE